MTLHIRHLGLQPYLDVWEKMKHFSSVRNEHTADELWLLEHDPIYTQGLAGKAEHILSTTSDIPVIHSDRGGQVTYHGPGQLIAYVLMDLRKRHLGVRDLVCHLEQLLIALLAEDHIVAETRCGAPGVYTEGKKIASIGLRVKNGCTYHGIALNVAMDLSPFERINPCGFKQLEMTQIKQYAPHRTVADVSKQFAEAFYNQFFEW